MSKNYFHEVYDRSLEMECPIEGWHTESGPGVFEAVCAMLYSQTKLKIADMFSGFDLLTSISNGRQCLSLQVCSFGSLNHAKLTTS